MATRSRTKLKAANSPPSPQKSAISSPQIIKDEAHQEESDKAHAVNGIGKSKIQQVSPTRKIFGKTRGKKPYCVCRQPDDGTPMVNCSACKDWFHFRCINLNERDAVDISIYFCPNCTERTGRRTVMEWEGPDAIEPVDPSDEKHSEGSEVDEIESEGEPSSEDEYIADQDLAKKKAAAARRRTRRLSISSESESEEDEGPRPRRIKTKHSTSPPPLKRKSHSNHPPPAKRKKSAETSATDDPARKYCLGKLQEVFVEIFLKYPHVPGSGNNDGADQTEKKLEELTEEERSQTEASAKNFAAELEQCVYDIYSEPDKQGKPSAGGKYRERFRMLQFNLSKPDRVMLHKRIASSDITPKELSLMSSTDLANEEQKQNIKMAEKEALEHSILQVTKVPRAKITHKGLQDIEDIDGDVTGPRGREREREEEEEAKREQERMARLKAAALQKQRSASTGAHDSVPPESPVVPQTPTWGGPPQLPLHAQSGETASDSNRPTNPLFVHMNSDFAMLEPELNLTDLINIDEDPSPQEALETVSTSLEIASEVVAKQTSPTSPTGISPFAAQSSESHAQAPSGTFDLNSLWNAPKAPATEVTEETASPPPEPPRDSFMYTDILGEEANDQDFDMFLEKEPEDAPMEKSPEPVPVTFDNLPPVWTGMINMPLDSSIPQETKVFARQAGGRNIPIDSPLWKTLFPQEALRIDGRVPVDNSSKFLLQVRMNPSKELIAAAFSPGLEASQSAFKTLSDYLIGKGRHGLIFPWGNRPKEYHPGRELYVVPLLASDPLPEYMELLDDLRLPKVRTSNYLIGIWVLNKGKLAPPPTLAPAHVPSVPLPPPIPNTSSASAPTQTPNITPALAAEVASLTPEQIQMMLRTLAAANPLVIPSTSYQNPVPPAPPSQTWPNGIPAYPPTYPTPPTNLHPPAPPPSPGSSFNRPPYDRDSRPPPGQGYDRNERHDRNDRSWRGGGKGGRSKVGRGNQQDTRKPLDSGWPRKTGSGRGGGPSSPQQSRWGNSTSQRS